MGPFAPAGPFTPGDEFGEVCPGNVDGVEGLCVCPEGVLPGVWASVVFTGCAQKKAPVQIRLKYRLRFIAATSSHFIK
jgi:hypothetical protein